MATRRVTCVPDVAQRDIVCMVRAGAAGVYMLKRYYGTDQGSKVIDAFLLKVPVMGMLIRKVAAARFTRTLGALISSGVAILEGLLITARSAGNRVVEATVMEARAAVPSGRRLSE